MESIYTESSLGSVRGSVGNDYSGWLHKLGHGRLKIWKRRYFILNVQRSTLTYFNKDPSKDHKLYCKGELHLTNFSEPGISFKKVPRELDARFGLILATTNPRRAMVFVLAESEEEKKLWILHLSYSLNKNRLIEELRLPSNFSEIKNRRKACRTIQNIIDSLTLMETTTTTNSTSTSKQKNFNMLGSRAKVLIAIYAGSITTISRMSVVSKSWHVSYSMINNRLLWQWIIRSGGVTEKDRWTFWCHVAGVAKVPNEIEFERLLENPKGNVVLDIQKDVNRAFGSAPNKRVVPRRSILIGDVDVDLQGTIAITGNSGSNTGDDQQQQLPSLLYGNSHHALDLVKLQQKLESLSDNDSCASPTPTPSTPVAPSTPASAIMDPEVENVIDIDDEEDDEDIDSLASNSVSASRKSSGYNLLIPTLFHRKISMFYSTTTTPTRSNKESSTAIPITSTSTTTVETNLENGHRIQSARRESFSPELSSDYFISIPTSPPYPGGSSTTSSHTTIDLPVPPPAHPYRISQKDIERKRHSLTRILLALASRFEDVGYCQGLDRIVIHIMRAARCAVSTASVLPHEVSLRDELDKIREREVYAFTEALFINLNLSEMFSRFGVFGLRMRIFQLAKLMVRHCPELYNHMINEGITPEVFGISWIQTLFLYVEAMPANTVDQIWDVFIFESRWNIIFSVAIAILKLSETELLNRYIDEIIDYFDHFPDPRVLHQQILLQEAQAIDISTEELTELENEFRENG